MLMCDFESFLYLGEGSVDMFLLLYQHETKVISRSLLLLRWTAEQMDGFGFIKESINLITHRGVWFTAP